MQTNNTRATTIAPTGSTAAAHAAQVAAIHATVRTSALRTARITRVQQALFVKHLAAKHAKYVQATTVAKHAAYNLAVQQLAAQYGVTVPVAATRTINGSATNIAPKHAPSAQTGSCALVHQLAAQHGYNRAATLAACAAKGINPATAATQYNIARKAHAQAQASAM
jgi:hypothetical protein